MLFLVALHSLEAIAADECVRNACAVQKFLLKSIVSLAISINRES